jgi:PIN domain nuclease of toxin-antitoxin system
VKLLLDTHAFIWWSDEPERLPDRVVEALRDPGNELMLSAISVLEMQLKLDTGKLDLAMPLPDLVRKHERENRLAVLPLRVSHVYAMHDLPRLHKDPFDRLLVAQAVVEEASLVSGDEDVGQYPVTVFW